MADAGTGADLEAEIIAAVSGKAKVLEDLNATLVRVPSLMGEDACAQDFVEGLVQGLRHRLSNALSYA